MSRDPNVIRIKPYHYIHVLDNNTNVTRVEVGPNTYTRQVRKNIYHDTPLACVVTTSHYHPS
jgi:major vault protein